jgi:hypothetical protein
MATSYNPYYSGGWQSGEEGGTPITPDALNHMDEGIAGAYDTVYGGNLPSGTNLNDLTETRFWYLTMGGTYTNHPASGIPTTLLVFSQNKTTQQFCVQIAVTGERVFIRKQFSSGGSGWGAWQLMQMSGCGWQPSGTDLNDLIYPGTYGVSGGSTNKHYPTGVTGGVLTVVNPGTSSAYCIQRLEIGSVIYMRYKGASSGTAFGSWYKYTGTAV